MKIIAVVNLVLLLVLAAAGFGYWKSERGSEVLKGKDWTAKK